MPPLRSIRLMAVVILFTALRASADETPHKTHPVVDLGNLGTVQFDVTCNETVRREFARAVAMVHSFWYQEAEKAFTRVSQKDRDCAMAHWGVAIANYHPLWTPPTKDELRRGANAAAKAKSIGTSSERERQLIDAVATFYGDWEKLDHPTRAAAYAEAMRTASAKFPKDDEIAIFHALALLGTASPTDKTYAVQKEAAAILNRILPRKPKHPGVAHYIIHSFDYPALAPLALSAARSYAKIAPGSPHALHMPSHIFTRLGLWDESISSNVASAEKAREYTRQLDPGKTAFDELHAVDYLVYAHLQRGEDEKAATWIERIRAVDGAKLDASVFQAAYALATAPARWTVERNAWHEAAELKLAPANFPWETFRYAESNIQFAKALGAARSGRLDVAQAAVDRLVAIRDQLQQQKNAYWAEQANIQSIAARAWLAQAGDRHAEALELAREAAAREDATEKHPVTPGPIIPARELLAELLLEQSRPSEALTEIERSLTIAPNRHRALVMAAAAADAAGDPKRAAAFRKTLRSVAPGSRRVATAASLRN
jgi:tetratricopeptide (TPR) repeat protein